VFCFYPAEEDFLFTILVLTYPFFVLPDVISLSQMCQAGSLKAYHRFTFQWIKTFFTFIFVSIIYQKSSA